MYINVPVYSSSSNNINMCHFVLKGVLTNKIFFNHLKSSPHKRDSHLKGWEQTFYMVFIHV